MNDANVKAPVTIQREELYRQVWTTPMSRLAKTYGITGNGLAKVCDRLKVPYPPRGYWAKKAAGKKVVQDPATRTRRGHARIGGHPTNTAPNPPAGTAA